MWHTCSSLAALIPVDAILNPEYNTFEGYIKDDVSHSARSNAYDGETYIEMNRTCGKSSSTRFQAAVAALCVFYGHIPRDVYRPNVPFFRWSSIAATPAPLQVELAFYDGHEFLLIASIHQTSQMCFRTAWHLHALLSPLSIVRLVSYPASVSF